jgi:hypothetical protein
MDIWSVFLLLIGLALSCVSLVLDKRLNKRWAREVYWSLRLDDEPPTLRKIMAYRLDSTRNLLFFVVGLIIVGMVILL